MNDQQELDHLCSLLSGCSRGVFFTGAGISTESGIPDYRSPGTGLWETMKPIPFQDFVSSAEARATSWQRKFSSTLMTSAVPNKGHVALKALCDTKRFVGVITQNVDNLHQVSGLASEQIIELHGNATYARCLSCQRRYDLEPLRALFVDTGEVPPCEACSGLIKTATISFGQSMPEHEMKRAEAWLQGCDLMFVLGSSLTVYPAAGFPEVAVRMGATLVIINRESTGLDHLADLVIREPIGEVMSACLDRLSDDRRPT